MYQVLPFNGVTDVLTLLGLTICAWEDFREGEIHYRWLLLIVDFHFPEAYLCCIVFFLSYHLYEKYIGGADVIILLLLLSRYGLSFVMELLFLSSALALLYVIIRGKRSIRFIPFMLLGFLFRLLLGR